MYRTFWTCSQVLLPLYITYKTLSGFTDTQNYKRVSAWWYERKRKDHYYKILPDVAEQTSATERRADEAERDTDKLKMVEYMEQFKGEKFSGVISGVTNWGIYVELINTIEGMVL